jgi:glutaredoxin 3
MKDIKVYVKEGCPWCVELEDYMLQKGLNYESIEVLSNADKFNEMIAISGQSKAPVVVIDEEVFADTDKETMEKVFIEKGLV